MLGVGTSVAITLAWPWWGFFLNTENNFIGNNSRRPGETYDKPQTTCQGHIVPFICISLHKYRNGVTQLLRVEVRYFAIGILTNCSLHSPRGVIRPSFHYFVLHPNVPQNFFACFFFSQIILPTATSAFAAQLYAGGRTTHSMFKVCLLDFYL